MRNNEEIICRRLIKDLLDRPVMRGVHLVQPRVLVPVLRRGDGAPICEEADIEDVVLPEELAAPLPDVDLAAPPAHVGVSRVADVRVVCPDDDLGRTGFAIAALGTQVVANFDEGACEVVVS